MICVEIDEITPCLKDSLTGELVETRVVQITSKDLLKNYNKSTGWYINWSSLLLDNEIYALIAKDIRSIQGLVAVGADNDMQASFVTWMVAAPQNNPQKIPDGVTKHYSGVGGHLFAIASQMSCRYGFEGAISGFAANIDLMNHYCDIFNAEAICMLHPYQIFISKEDSRLIREVYDYEWTNEII